MENKHLNSWVNLAFHSQMLDISGKHYHRINLLRILMFLNASAGQVPIVEQILPRSSDHLLFSLQPLDSIAGYIERHSSL